MSAHNRVVWSEGLFLQPQHFQQQDRHFERYVENRSQALHPYGWGFTELAVERDLLAIGKFGLRSAAGVCPDGTPFRMPDDDPLPAPLDIGAEVRDEILYFAIPIRRPGEGDVDRGGATDGLERHAVREVQARDTSAAGGNTAVVEVAALKTRFLLQRDVTGAYACVPLAHVVERRADQQVVLDEQFIPTVVSARAATRLTTILAEVVGLVHQRAEALGGRVAATGRGSAAEIADFLMLEALNRFEPVLVHYADSGLVHPEQLYRTMVAIAGELATFTTVSKRPPKFTAYRHEHLRESFDPVIVALRAELSAVLEQAAIAIPVEARRFGISVAVVADRALYDQAVFVLAARADVPAEDLRRRFPTQLRIGPVEKIRDLVTLQLPGIPVRAVPVAPRQIPYHAGSAYFELDQHGDLWEQLRTSGGIALHVAGDFPGLAMEFWAIRS